MFRYLRRSRTSSAVAALLDKYFGYNSLLLNGETPSSSFTSDASPNALPMYPMGAVRNDSFSPFDAGNYSILFNGSTDYLSFPANANLSLGSGDFTIEFWLNAPSQVNTFIYDNRGNTSSSYPHITLGVSTPTLRWGPTGTTGTIVIADGLWHHCAVTRQSGTIKLWVDGVLDASGADATNYSASYATLIGNNSFGASFLTGYVSNLRIAKGTAVYTASFTPASAPITAIASTTLLTCQDARFKDNSTNNFTATVNGTPKVQPKSPFAYTPIAGSGYFNGTTDYLSSPSNSQFQLAGNFTVEGWFNISAYPSAATSTLFDQRITNGNTTGIGFYLSPSIGGLSAWSGGAAIFTSGTSPSLNAWHHFAYVRSAGTLTAYLDGVSVASAVASANYTDTACRIGVNAATAGYFAGYLSNVRLVNGTAVYAGAFTPSTAPLSLVTNTALLTLQKSGPANNSGFLDASGNHFPVAMSGTVAQGQFSPFSNTGWSGQFSGTTYFTAPIGAFPSLSASTNYTQELWIYVSAYAGTYSYIMGGAQAVGGTNIFVTSTGLLYGQVNNTQTAPVSTIAILSNQVVPLNSWHHVAMVRNNGIVTLYYDGVSVGSIADATALVSSILYVGGPSTALANATYSLNGYASNARIVAGYAVYTANFTPPTAPLTAISGMGYTTSFLSLQNGYLKDNSTNNYTITNTGVVSQVASPFEPISVWSSSANGGSMYFNKVGSFLTVPASSAFDIGTGNCTIEAWIYLADVTGYKTVVAFSSDFRYGLVVNGNRLCAFLSSNGTAWNGMIGDSSGQNGYGSIALTAGQWYHVALTRTGNVWNTYINGVMDLNVTLSITVTPTAGTTPLTIGNWGNNLDTYRFNGYISNVRITKGAALYKAFIPATASFPDSVASDSYFGQVSLLIHGDGSNGANNNTVLDSSSNAITVSRAGTPGQGTFSPFSQGGWSAYFNGSSAYLTSANASNSNFGTDPYTFEVWVNPPTATANGSLYDGRPAANGTQFAIGVASGAVGLFYNAAQLFTGTATLPANKWTHVAVVRSGTGTGQTALYLNGTLSQVFTDASNYTQAATTIGTTAFTLNGNPFTGYLSNMRIVKGVAVYTAPFIPSTAPLTAITGTTLLALQSSSWIDNSPSNMTLSATGTPSTQPLSASNVTTYSASANGGSLYFNGTTDYVYAAANSALALGTGDFTVEAWVYFNSVSGTYVPFCQSDAVGSSSSDKWFFALHSSTLNFGTHSGGGYNASTPWTPSTGVWYHVAVTRTSGVTSMFINGVSGTVTGSASGSGYNLSQNGTVVGVMSTPFYFNGFLSNVRIVKGLAVYTGAFTPSTTPLTAVSGTSLLLSGTNGGVTDVQGRVSLSTIGSASVNTSIFKYGTGSLSFNGSTDYINSAPTQSVVFGTGDFTVEAWIYTLAGAAATTGVFQISTAASGGFSTTLTASVALLIVSNKLQCYCNNTFYTGTTTIPNGVWTHVAISRASGVTKTYVNGVMDFSIADTVNYSGTSFVIGGAYSTGNLWNGYIDDFRITKGYARYTANFIPLTAPLSPQPTTQLLISGNTAVIDYAGKNDIQTIGSAQVTNVSSKFGNAALDFTVNGNYLRMPCNQGFNFGKGDFTVEFWINKTSSGQVGTNMLFNMADGTTTFTGLEIYCTSTGAIGLYMSSNGTTWDVASALSAGQISNNTWYHYAVVRSGTVIRAYLNGVGVAFLSVASTLSLTYSATNFVVVGGNSSGMTFGGYLDDLRVTKGYARYNGGFTAPVSAYSDNSEGDAYFNQVSLLLHAEGNSYTTSVANNNVFVDSSINAFTISRGGSATQGTLSPFNTGGWSAYFAGDQSDIGAPSSAAFGFGTGAWTLEAFVYPTANPTNGPGTIFELRAGATASPGVVRITSALKISFYDGVDTPLTGGSSVTLNAWNHIAVVKSGTTVTGYINGVLAGTVTSSADFGASLPCYVGANQTAGYGFNGYISNARVVKGVAVYTGAFLTPTAALTATQDAGTNISAITGTQCSLLTFQNSRFKDNSANNFTLSAAGSMSAVQFSPFNTASAYSADISGESFYFNGTTDYLGITPASAIALGVLDFTIEMWVYSTSNVVGTLFSTGANSSTNPFLYMNGLVPTLYYNAAGIVAGPAIALNTWNHIALVRSSTTFRIYTNGVSTTSTTYGDSMTSAGPVFIGCNSTNTQLFAGYLSNMRIVKGAALYTSNFVPPTAPLGVVGNTVLRLAGSNSSAGIIDGAGKNNLVTVGVFTQSSVYKYGTGALSFSGSSTYLSMPAQSHNVIGTSTATVEFWMYPTAQDSYRRIVSSTNGGFATGSFCIRYNNGLFLAGAVGGNSISWNGYPTLNAWNHLAWVGVGGSSQTLYVNGVSVGTSGSYNITEAIQYIGGYNTAGPADFYQGYLDDLRVTKGVARYTSTFTPATMLLPSNSVVDPYFNQVSLLLQGEPQTVTVNVSKNNVFVDSSANKFALTVTGTPTQGTFSPYAQGGWSLYLTTSQYVTASASTAYDVSGADFTFETWVNMAAYNTMGSSGTSLITNFTGGGGWAVSIDGVNGITSMSLTTYVAGTPQTAATDATITAANFKLNTWNHVAVVRVGSSIYFYLNGVCTGGAKTAPVTGGTGSTLAVGVYQQNLSYSGNPQMYLSNMRVVKGAAVYTANFAPSTAPLVAISGTSFLAFQDSTLKDNSTIAATLTANGALSFQAKAPTSVSSYSAAANSGSIYFNGTTDILTLPTTFASNLGTADFTFECWVNADSTGSGANRQIVYFDGFSNGYVGLGVMIDSTNHLTFTLNGSVTANITATWAQSMYNSWVHIALVRQGSVFTAYVNGVSVGTYTSASAMPAYTINNIGAYNGAYYYFKGYISNVRLVSGTALYTSAFTPPVSPLTVIANTQLLLGGTNGAVIDSSGTSEVVLMGTAQVGSNSKFGNGALITDGTSTSYAYVAGSNMAFGQGDFTIEMWVFLNAVTAMDILDFRPVSTNGAYLYIGTNAGGIPTMYVNSGTQITSSKAIAVSTWTHLAISRVSGVTRMFINGALSATPYTDSFVYLSGANRPVIGCSGFSGTATFNGAIDDLRITKGIGRYTGNFTAPISAVPTN